MTLPLPYLIPAIVLIVGILYLIRACMIAYGEGCTERLKSEAMTAPLDYGDYQPWYLEHRKTYTVTRVVDPARESVSRMYVGADGRLFEETPA